MVSAGSMNCRNMTVMASLSPCLARLRSAGASCTLPCDGAAIWSAEVVTLTCPPLSRGLLISVQEPPLHASEEAAILLAPLVGRNLRGGRRLTLSLRSLAGLSQIEQQVDIPGQRLDVLFQGRSERVEPVGCCQEVLH